MAKWVSAFGPALKCRLNVNFEYELINFSRNKFSERFKEHAYDELSASSETATSIVIYMVFLLHFSQRELRFTFAICCRPSSVCRLSVTLVRRSQAVEIFGNFSMPFGTLAIRWRPWKMLRRSFQGTPPLGGGELNARGVTKYSDFGPVGGYLGNGAR